MLYLDNAATTQVHEEVKQEMIKYLSTEFGNAEVDFYDLGLNSKKAIDHAKVQVANLISCDTDEIIFTSGATESNNFIIKGIANQYKEKGNHIITTKTEHSSVLNVCRFLETKGFEVTYLDVDEYGRIDIEDLMNAIKEKTILITIIWGNNELGSLNNIEKISSLIDEYKKETQQQIFFHSDATQVVGKKELNLKKLKGLDFISFSAHKIYGPKGIGAAIIKNDYDGIKPQIEPLVHGGGQQNNIRGGTEPVHNIVGFGKACEIVNRDFEKNYNNLINLENKLKEIIKDVFSNQVALRFNSDEKNKIPGILNIHFKNVKNKKLLSFLNENQIYASTGSACSVRKPSHVLKAIGLSQVEIEESLRFSLSPYEKFENLTKTFKSL